MTVADPHRPRGIQQSNGQSFTFHRNSIFNYPEKTLLQASRHLEPHPWYGGMVPNVLSRKMVRRYVPIENMLNMMTMKWSGLWYQFDALLKKSFMANFVPVFQERLSFWVASRLSGKSRAAKTVDRFCMWRNMISADLSQIVHTFRKKQRLIYSKRGFRRTCYWAGAMSGQM